MTAFERGLRPRNRIMGEASEGAVEAPSEKIMGQVSEGAVEAPSEEIIGV